MYTARFLYSTYEIKYAIKDSSLKDEEGWFLDEFKPIWIGKRTLEEMIYRYKRVKEKNLIFHEEKTSIYFKEGDSVRVKDDVVNITRVVKTLDGSIEYHTNKTEITKLNTRETYFDERK
ncbi:hypothetical protein PQE68_gp126 [Bacillus phage vB_BanS_Sophrita]|uniref:Uncharacterized protein n=1 Tax=Bacillus phage vB_BanS_Sophrita TaxID=2894790 RepID=A0AAE9CEA4_9CAUD|nr:hypothetical protein PQE68_gp126 [Bacillus phage vB_BanS_Sophrita]UGO50717.1 hypothetical protein SOPHRITA_126 [Bacillus phage vB_BanS_Sophrita]